MPRIGGAGPWAFMMALSCDLALAFMPPSPGPRFVHRSRPTPGLHSSARAHPLLAREARTGAGRLGGLGMGGASGELGQSGPAELTRRPAADSASGASMGKAIFRRAVQKPLTAAGAGLRSLICTALLSMAMAALWNMPANAAAAAAAPAAVDQWALFVTKFRRNWHLYLTIPVIAGLLNWATNNLAVKMIFYPMEFVGLKIKTWPETPLGLIGWTGIVPVKAKSMSTRMVRMVTGSLIDVKEVFARLSPKVVAEKLMPGTDSIIEAVAKDLKVGALIQSPGIYLLAQKQAGKFIESFTGKMQENIKEVFDLEGMVVSAMVKDKNLIVELFQECGKDELTFVVRSGLYFGFLLGIVQMAIWVVWDPWWSLAVGGALVGYLTNLFAIKSIFEPVQPVKIGPWKIQGLFLTRQYAVSAEFAAFLSAKVLTSEKIWREILFGARKEKFAALLESHADEFVAQLPGGALVQSGVGRDRLKAVLKQRLLEGLGREVFRLHTYVDETLELEKEMRDKMRLMSSEQFEGVLHPIFEEDEATLIACGAVLGLTAGFLQSLAPY